MSEYVKHVSQRKCTKDLLHAVLFFRFGTIKEIVFLSKEKGLWSFLSILDEKFTVLSSLRLLREVMG